MLNRFDMKLLRVTLDAERRSHRLSWIELAADINRPFQGTPSIPINVSTIKGMAAKSSVTSAVVLQVLRWLGRTPESFLSGYDRSPQAEERLPDPGPSRILRFDTKALYASREAREAWAGIELEGARSPA
jgi:hypothetical protein